MVDLTSHLHGAKIFSKLDPLKGYFQGHVHPEHVPKTLIRIHPFSCSTFSLHNSGANFQRLMDGILTNLPYCAFYVDDILISISCTKHLEHIWYILRLLWDNGLIVL